jgi:hypothetical protein
MTPRGFDVLIWIGALIALFALLSGRMLLLGWTLFGVMLVWNFGRHWLHAHKENALDAFIVYLLLDDDIRTKQKQGLEEWIRTNDAKDASALSSRAGVAIGALAQRLWQGDPAKPGSSSVLGMHAMLWERRQALVAGSREGRGAK